MSKKTDDKTTAAEEAVEQTFLTKQSEKPASGDRQEYQISSTETVTLNDADFRKLKLTV